LVFCIFIKGSKINSFNIKVGTEVATDPFFQKNQNEAVCQGKQFRVEIWFNSSVVHGWRHLNESL